MARVIVNLIIQLARVIMILNIQLTRIIMILNIQLARVIIILKSLKGPIRTGVAPAGACHYDP